MKKGLSGVENKCLKIFRNTRQGSYETRDRYKKSCLVFCRFLNEKFKMKNLENLQDKHIISYIEHRQKKGISAKTIKSDLAAIRFMHNQMNAKYELSTNEQLTKKFDVYLEATPKISGDRAWDKDEYSNMLRICEQIENSHKDSERGQTARDVRDIIILCRTMGFRLAEACAVSRAQVEHALRTGTYRIGSEAKNGRSREVKLSNEAKAVFERRKEIVARGGRLFTRRDEKVHQVENRCEKFLERHREKAETIYGRVLRMYEGKAAPLTFHGLRYAYVQERVREEMQKGFSYNQAAQIVTKEVGHNRVSVIAVYMAGKKE